MLAVYNDSIFFVCFISNLQSIVFDDDNEELPPPPSMKIWNQGNAQEQYNPFPVNPLRRQLGDYSDKLEAPSPAMSLFPSAANANDRTSDPMKASNLEMCVATSENRNTFSLDEVLLYPGRLNRPKRICIILRGPPGCGKSHVARLIKEKELEMGGANPRILSIDDYFLIENDYDEKCPKTGKKVRRSVVKC